MILEKVRFVGEQADGNTAIKASSVRYYIQFFNFNTPVTSRSLNSVSGYFIPSEGKFFTEPKPVTHAKITGLVRFGEPVAGWGMYFLPSQFYGVKRMGKLLFFPTEPDIVRPDFIVLLGSALLPVFTLPALPEIPEIPV